MCVSRRDVRANVSKWCILPMSNKKVAKKNNTYVTQYLGSIELHPHYIWWFLLFVPL